MTKEEKELILKLVTTIESGLQIQHQSIDVQLTGLDRFKEELVTK